jgi:AcrR family transcriptional regulator
MVRTLSSERREKILSTALMLFVRNGMKNTSTAEIAKEAGIATGTLFLYFPTKQDLLDELVLKMAKEQSDFVRTLLEPSLSARETFSAIWQGSLHWLLDHLDAYQYVQQVRDTGMISGEIVQETGKYLSYYFEAIQKGYQEGCIKLLPVNLIGGFLYQDIVAVMSYLQMQTDSSKIEEIIQQGFEIYWDGIKSGNNFLQGGNDEI